jgi:hypothetical protein
MLVPPDDVDVSSPPQATVTENVKSAVPIQSDVVRFMFDPRILPLRRLGDAPSAKSDPRFAPLGARDKPAFREARQEHLTIM